VGVGLLTIQERIQAMGGNFKLDSSPGGGACIRLTLPIHEEPQEVAAPAAAGEAGEAARSSPAPSAGARYRVLFADDHQVIRQGLVAMLRGQPDIQVVGEAANGQEAVELAHSLSPDVVVMDVSMPEMDGVEATRRIKAEQPAIRVIGLSMLEEAEIAERMRQAGAEAFVNKAESAGTLLRAIYGIFRPRQRAGEYPRGCPEDHPPAPAPSRGPPPLDSVDVVPGLLVQPVGPGRHDEVVAVQTLDLVGPPSDPDPPPLGQEGRVVALCLRFRAYAGGEGQGAGEVAEAEGALQGVHPVVWHKLPAGHFRQELPNLLGAERRLAPPAGQAFFSVQVHANNVLFLLWIRRCAP
jgi:CheY-like chemotaxis protein